MPGRVPSFFRRCGQAAAYVFGYNAVADKGRRQSPQSRHTSEDGALHVRDWAKLGATATDMARNFELAAWMVRMHVEYVSQFDAHVNSGDKAVDAALRWLLQWHARAEVFDVARRRSRNETMRLFEIARVFCGDAALVHLANGSVQGIPGKRIAKPTDLTGAPEGLVKRVTDRGLVIDNATGAVEAYCICRWDERGRQLVFDHFEDARNVNFAGYFTDFDQTRGVSPLASALNRMQDTAEALEWTQLKIKLHALFGLAFSRESSTPIYAPPTLDSDATPGESTSPKYEVNLAKGVQILDLDPGGKVDVIESKTPSAEFVDYSELAMRLGMLGLDIPYSFFDSRKANYSARIADANQYEFLAEGKRETNRDVLQRYSDWKVGQWLAVDSPLTQPLRKAVDAAGLSVTAVRRSVEWIGRATPWVDKLKQIQGDQIAIANGLDSRQRICRRRGQGDWHGIADELGGEEAYAREKGATIMVGAPGQSSADTSDGDSPDAQQ